MHTIALDSLWLDFKHFKNTFPELRIYGVHIVEKKNRCRYFPVCVFAFYPHATLQLWGGFSFVCTICYKFSCSFPNQTHHMTFWAVIMIGYGLFYHCLVCDLKNCKLVKFGSLFKTFLIFTRILSNVLISSILMMSFNFMNCV